LKLALLNGIQSRLQNAIGSISGMELNQDELNYELSSFGPNTNTANVNGINNHRLRMRRIVEGDDTAITETNETSTDNNEDVIKRNVSFATPERGPM